MLLQKLLQRRSNQIYYFRWVCPDKVRQIVGKRELIKSLHTRELYIASVRAATYYSAVLKIDNILRMTDLTDEQIEAAVQRAWSKVGSGQQLRRTEQELELVVRKVHFGLDSALKTPFGEEELGQFLNFGVDDRLDYWSEEVAGLSDQFDQVTGRFYCSPDSIVEVLGKHKINHEDYHRDDCEWLFQELRLVEIDLARQLRTKYYGWESQLHYPSSKIINKPQAPAKALKFSELYSQFIDHKVKFKKLSEDMQAGYRRAFNDFIDLEGDLPISDIKRMAVEEFIMEKCRYLPKRNLKEYRGKCASELLQMEIPEEDLIADKTAKDVFKFLQGIFAFAVKKGFLAVSPSRDVKLELDSSISYGAYSKTQVRAMLKAGENLTGWKYWVAFPRQDGHFR